MKSIYIYAKQNVYVICNLHAIFDMQFTCNMLQEILKSQRPKSFLHANTK